MKTVVSPQSQLINVHLEEDNYLLWKFQVETAIYGYGLEGFVLGTIATPPKFVTESEQVLILMNGLNEDFESIVAAITTKKATPPLDEVHPFLLYPNG